MANAYSVPWERLVIGAWYVGVVKSGAQGGADTPYTHGVVSVLTAAP